MAPYVYCLGCGTGFRFNPESYPLKNGMCAECVREMRRPNYQLVEENKTLRVENERLRREHREFVDGLTRALNDAGVPAMPSWQEAIDYLARRHSDA